MGLFGNLFKSRKEEPSDKVRAQFKDKSYFEKQIERCNLFIKNDQEDFELYIKNNGALNSQHYITATNIRIKKIENFYSKGEDVKLLVPIYEEALEYFLQSWSNDYKNNLLAVQMLSFMILLHSPKSDLIKMEAFVKKWESNSSIEDYFKPHPLIYYLLGKGAPDRLGYEPFDKLYEITKLPKDIAEKSMKEYLDKWYSMHKDQPWYNTHLRDSGYSGYWAWGAAAVVKAMRLDDSSFKDNSFYPYDIVYWNDANNIK